jgi:hypothetical protein
MLQDKVNLIENNTDGPKKTGAASNSKLYGGANEDKL